MADSPGSLINSIKLLNEGLMERREVNVPVCTFPRKRPLHVFYSYLKGKPRSHCLEFRKGKRPVFLIELPHLGEDMAKLLTVAQNEKGSRTNADPGFGFWTRLLLWLVAGSVVSSRALFQGPEDELSFGSQHASSISRYRLACCQRGAKKSIVLVSSECTTVTKRYSTARHNNVNWLTLSQSEWKEMTGHLQAFLSSREFADIKKAILTENRQDQ